MSSVLEHSEVEAKVEPEESPYLFNTDEFYRLLETEFFPREARVGLWDGRIYEKMSKTQAHAVASINATMTLARILPPGWCLSGENPFTVSPNKAPLPDMIVLRGNGKDYIKRRPDAADVGLVIEFSHSSLKIDTGTKLDAYARTGVVAYWVLNLRDNVIQVYENPIPAEGRYATQRIAGRDDSIPFSLDGTLIANIAALDLLPIL
jgi:Uma2 family endonuclease